MSNRNRGRQQWTSTDGSKAQLSGIRKKKEIFRYHGSLHPPSGHSISNASGFDNAAVRSGCFSHLTGRPSYTCPFVFIKSKNFRQISRPLRAFMKLSELPIMIIPLRALERRTFNLSAADMNPISCDLFDRVRDTITMSRSSPW